MENNTNEIGIQKQLRPKGITVIAVINLIAVLLTIAFWYTVQQYVFNAVKLINPAERYSNASTYGFMFADLIWAVPALVISIWGLLKMKFWGWTAAQLINFLWFYSLSAIVFRDVYLGSMSPGGIIFLPFGVIAIWAFIYLWRKRDLFS